MMTTTFPKYESYKDSGVEWLGEIPSHWNIKKLKFCCKSNVRVLPENAPPDLQIQYVDIGSVSQGKIERVEYHAFKDAPSRARRLAQRGDTIISTVRTYLKAISYIEEEYEDCIFSTGFAVLNPSNFFDSKFFSYLLQSEIFIDEVVRYSKGVSFPAITSLELGNLPVSIPNIEEQKRIVEFLDRTTTDIDRAIAQKQRLIELLKEQKAIVINQAVTKGLNPNVPTHDSGAEWLGKISEHWSTTKIKHIAKFVSGGTPSKENIEYWDGDIPWVSPKDMKQRYIDGSEDKITSKALQKTTLQLLDIDAVLIGRI